MEEYFAHLAIISSVITDDEMYERVPLEYNRKWNPKNPRLPRMPKPYEGEEFGISFSSTLANTESIELHIANLLARLEPHVEGIASLADRGCYVQFGCAVYMISAPPIYFSPDQIQQIGRMKAGLDLDLYIMREDPDPTPDSPDTPNL